MEVILILIVVLIFAILVTIESYIVFLAVSGLVKLVKGERPKK